MSSSEPRVGVGHTRTVIAKKEAALSVLSARYEDFAHRVEAVDTEGPRFPSDRASLKVLAYEGSFPPLEIRNYAGFGR